MAQDFGAVWLLRSFQRLRKAVEGFQRLPRLPEAPGDQVGSGSEGARGVRETRPLSLTEAPRLLKAPKASQGLRQVPVSQGGLASKG